MTTIISLCGSLRRGSFNGMLLRAAIEMAPSGTVIEPESIREIPLYDADLEEEHGMPPAVERLKNRIAQADGLLIVTPEYNNSVPGVLQNAIDWLSRPGDDIARVFRARPVAIMRATTGVGGTGLSQAALLVSLLAGVVFGVAPALQAAATDPNASSHLWTGRAGVGGQFAMCSCVCK